MYSRRLGHCSMAWRATMGANTLRTTLVVPTRATFPLDWINNARTLPLYPDIHPMSVHTGCAAAMQTKRTPAITRLASRLEAGEASCLEDFEGRDRMRKVAHPAIREVAKRKRVVRMMAKRQTLVFTRVLRHQNEAAAKATAKTRRTMDPMRGKRNERGTDNPMSANPVAWSRPHRVRLGNVYRNTTTRGM